MSHLLRYSNHDLLAERFARQALAMDQTLYGSRHARVAVDLGHLGVILSSQRKVVEAESLLRESIALLRSVYPNGHADLAHALRDLAVHLTTTKRWEEAEQTWRETAAAYLAQPNESMGYANAQSFLGRATMENGKLAEAERTLRATLRLESAGVPVGNPIGVRASMYLGELLRRQGQFKEAVPLLLAAHRARMPNRHAEIYSAAALVKLYEAEGRMDEAAKYRAPSSP